MKLLLLPILSICIIQIAIAQDFVVQNNGNVIRGTIRGTNGASVVIADGGNEMMMIEAKNAKNFFWNGDSYVSKGFAGGKKLDFKFLKVIEIGKLNLYSLGGDIAPPEKQQKKVGFRPSVGIGTGGGGFGGGIVIGGGGSQQERRVGAPKMRYFIEKPGSGPMQELPLQAITDPKYYGAIKNVLSQKMADNAELKLMLENTKEFNEKQVQDLVELYNSKVEKVN